MCQTDPDGRCDRRRDVRVACCRARARARRAAVLVPQHVRGGGRQRGAVALQVVRQGGVQPLAPLPLAHGAALAVPLLPRHLQPHRHAALAPAPQARRAAAQALSTTPPPRRARAARPRPRTSSVIILTRFTIIFVYVDNTLSHVFVLYLMFFTVW